MKNRHVWWNGWLLAVLLFSGVGIPRNGLSATRIVQSLTALAIDGPGWFELVDRRSGEHFFSRYGDFVLDESARLVTWEGFGVQGIAASGSVGDIVIDTTGMPATSNPVAQVISFNIETDGRIIVRLSDGTQFARAQMLLQDFSHRKKLIRLEPPLYAAVPEAGVVGSPRPPGTGGLGLLRTNVLELEEVRWSILPDFRRGDPLATGALTRTSFGLDLGIRGEGFFLLRDPITSELFATRAGFFLRDGDGYVISYTGLRVQGWVDSSFTKLGDMRIDETGMPTPSDPNAVMFSYGIARDGEVTVNLSDGSEFVRGRILLHAFHSPEQLVASGLGLFSGVAQAGPFSTDLLPASRAGRITRGALELINATRELLALRRKLPFFLQGPLRRTGNPTDLALTSQGFFVVRDPANGNFYATRRGDFHFDESGYFVTSRGWRVQGFINPGLSVRGDIRLDAQGIPSTSDPDAVMVRFSFDTDGKLNVDLSDGTQFTRAQVLLQNFAQSYSLISAGGSYWTNFAEARPLATLSAAGTSNLGRIQSEALEIPSRPTRLALPPRRGVRLLLIGEPGSGCTIQAKTGSKGWKTIGSVTLSGGEAEFVDQRPRKHTTPEYRVLVDPLHAEQSP